MQDKNWLKQGIASCLVMASVAIVSGCSSTNSEQTSANNNSGNNSGKVIRIAIGTQDQVINTAVGGATVRELGLLEKHLPKTGEYEGVKYDIHLSRP
ncbi:hypothetical protein [Leptolyngbya sp. 7M]|uniref:hypothetical protein n=1 Tax=Leptolyngbya sp. 7M TaxID=2812896 RepID=UPI001B8BF028|nr:hypothetical protein [Leptolyngbya sp. 7M]QYO68893.1 hypothetical protein JVX88_21710 [Leptolyngbya sp. 7M]